MARQIVSPMAGDSALSFQPQRPTKSRDEPLLAIKGHILDLPGPQREQRRQIPAAIVLQLSWGT